LAHALVGLVICFFGDQMRLGRRQAQESAGRIEEQAARLAQEIQEHQQTEAALRISNQRLQRVLASLTDAYFMLDRQFRFVELNRAAEKDVFGRPAAELVGKCFWDEFPACKQCDCHKRYRLALEEQQPAHFEAQSSLNQRWYEIHVYPSPECLEVYFRDVTERKKEELALQTAQADLRHTNEMLGQHVAERTADLLKTEHSLHAVTHSMAHDLRAPLRAMHSFTTLLLQRYGPKLDASGQQFARRISAAAERMDRLIRDLRAYGEICSLSAALSPIHTPQLVEGVVGKFRDSEAGRSANIRIQQPLPALRGNAQLLGRALEQLLHNAARFVPPKATPQIEIRAEEHDSVVRLCVRDNGIGIPPDFHERIFWVFERLPPHAHDGTGIGLAIVQKAVERMHGRVGLESAPGQGSLFWIELPKADAANGAPLLPES
jgi:PAS domain S-box-containing protein